MSNNEHIAGFRTGELEAFGGIASKVKPEIKMGITVEEELKIVLDKLINTETDIIQEDRMSIVECKGLKVTIDSIGFITVETSEWSFNNKNEFTWKKSDVGSAIFLSESIEVFLKRIQNFSVNIEKVKFTSTGMVSATTQIQI